VFLRAAAWQYVCGIRRPLSVFLSVYVCPLAGQMSVCLSVCLLLSSFSQSSLGCADKTEEKVANEGKKTHREKILKDKKNQRSGEESWRELPRLWRGGEKERKKERGWEWMGPLWSKGLFIFLALELFRSHIGACLHCLARVFIACPTSQQPALNHRQQPGQLRTKTSTSGGEKGVLNVETTQSALS